MLCLPRNLHMEVAKCCACHEICTSRFTQCCACHEICAWRFTKRCACHEICAWSCYEICAWRHKVLHLPRNLRMEVHKSAAPATKSAHGGSQSAVTATKSAHRGPQSAAPVHTALCLPRNLHMEVHKVLRLPRNLHFKKQMKTLIAMEGRFRQRSEHDPRMIRPCPETVSQPSFRRASPSRFGAAWRFTKCWSTKYCACHEICTSRNTQCCACHEICTWRFTQWSACHEIRDMEVHEALIPT